MNIAPMLTTRQPRRFRPILGEVLEDRTVPSSFRPGFVGRGIVSLPAQDAKQVAQEFRTFQQTYAQDVRTILLPPGRPAPRATGRRSTRRSPRH